MHSISTYIFDYTQTSHANTEKCFFALLSRLKLDCLAYLIQQPMHAVSK